ncbi:hypothetical protein T4A_1670 [Trichinella pseudospiralis]|uniref:Uncharacterized protein n=1 Tax=Trichinella pseudospiralis TaxID=6337 RepID=A0A0V1DY25_TRIPS|nr:hypothetical protein T4A_1670 [Trichinella pseudospiralis]
MYSTFLLASPLFKTVHIYMNLSSASKRTNAIKTGFRRYTMQITIAIKGRYYHKKKVKSRITRSKSRTALRRTRDEKRPDKAKQYADDTKRNKKRPKVCGSPWVPIL